MRPTGTLAYCSPEIVLSRPHNKQTDIWSLGVMLYASFARRMPFMANDKKQTITNIVREPIQFLHPPQVWLGRMSSQLVHQSNQLSEKKESSSSGSSGQSIGVSGVTNSAKQIIAMMVEKN